MRFAQRPRLRASAALASSLFSGAVAFLYIGCAGEIADRAAGDALRDAGPPSVAGNDSASLRDATAPNNTVASADSRGVDTRRPAVDLGMPRDIEPNQPKGHIYYVSPTGSDSNTCAQAASASTPRATINGGIGCMSGGDWLIVKPGTYHEIITNIPGVLPYVKPVPNGSSWSGATTIKAETPGTVVLSTATPYPGGAGVVVLENNSQYVVLDGFVIDGAHLNGSMDVGGDHVRIANTEIRYPYFSAVHVSGGYHEFINVNIHGAGFTTTGVSDCYGSSVGKASGYCHGYYFGGHNCLIDGGSLHDNDGHGIQFYREQPNDNIMRNVLVYNNKTGIGVYGRANVISNNVLVHNVNALTTLGGGITISHNTIYDGTWDCAICDQTSGSVIRDNLILKQTQAYIEPVPGDTSHNLCDKPMAGCAMVERDLSKLLLDPARGDFRLAPGSPARGAASDGLDIGADATKVMTPPP